VAKDNREADRSTRSSGQRRSRDLPDRRTVVANLARSAALAPAAGLVTACLASPTAAEEPTSSSQARREAAAAMPYDRLTAAARQQLEAVISRAAVFRRMPAKTIDCDRDLHLFLIRHPEVIVAIWREMGVTKVSMTRTGPFSFQASDNSGAESQIDLVYADAAKQVMFANTSYRGPLFGRKMHTRSVLLLRTKYVVGESGRTYANNTLDVFIRFDDTGTDVLARALNPLVIHTADKNFIQSINFIGKVARAAERNPAGLQRLAARLPGVQADVRQQFAVLTDRVARRAAERIAAGGALRR